MPCPFSFFMTLLHKQNLTLHQTFRKNVSSLISEETHLKEQRKSLECLLTFYHQMVKISTCHVMWHQCYLRPCAHENGISVVPLFFGTGPKFCSPAHGIGLKIICVHTRPRLKEIRCFDMRRKHVRTKEIAV